MGMGLRLLVLACCALALPALAGEAAAGADTDPGLGLSLQLELGAVARHHPSNQLAAPVSNQADDNGNVLAPPVAVASVAAGTGAANSAASAGAGASSATSAKAAAVDPPAAAAPRAGFGARLARAGAVVYDSLPIARSGRLLGGVLVGLLIALVVVSGGWLLVRMLQSQPLPSPRVRSEPVGWGAAPPPQDEPVPPLAPATADGSLPRLPPGFDLAGLLREARLAFARLRQAHDHADLTDLHSFTTPGMYEVLASQIHERLQHGRKGEVTGLDAQLVDLDLGQEEATATVRFHGSERGEGGDTVPFIEVWQVRKRLTDPRAYWLLDGIQPHL